MNTDAFDIKPEYYRSVVMQIFGLVATDDGPKLKQKIVILSQNFDGEIVLDGQPVAADGKLEDFVDAFTAGLRAAGVPHMFSLDTDKLRNGGVMV